MKALAKLERAPGLTLTRVKKPEVGHNDVMIRITRTAICGTDIHIWKWDEWAQKTIPVPMHVGHEYVGRIVEMGQEVRGFKIGDRVSGEGHITCGFCRNCRAGRRHLCRNTIGVGVNREGAFAEYLVIPAFNAFKIPDDISDDLASIFDPFGNATHTALSFNLVGEDVLITGAGPIGALSALASAALGASKIFVSEPNPNRRKQLEALGVTTRVVDPKCVNVVEMLRDETEEGVGVDSAIECSGTEAGLNTRCEAVRNHGTVAQVGLHVKKASVDPALWALKDITVEATWCYHVTMWPRIIGMVERGVYPVHKVISAQITADNVVEKGFKTLLDPTGNQMKVLVKVA